MLCRPPDTADSTTTRILSESKDSKDFINFIEHKTGKEHNPCLKHSSRRRDHECMQSIRNFYKNGLPIPTKFLRGMYCLILKENSFQFQ